VRGQLAQFLIDQREQFLCRRRFTARQGLQNDGDLFDGKRDAIFSPVKQEN